MLNNPMLQILQAARMGRNPQLLMQQLAQSNPQINQAMTMLQGKSPQEIRQMAENMCRERGTTPEQVMQMLGRK